MAMHKRCAWGPWLIHVWMTLRKQSNGLAPLIAALPAEAAGESGKDVSSDVNNMTTPSTQPPAPAPSSPTFSSSPPHPPFTTMPTAADMHTAADGAAGALHRQRTQRDAEALVADPADIDLPDSGGRARVGVFATQWQEELRLRQLLRTGARPFAGGASGSEGEELPSALLRGLATREFSVEELRALGSNHGNSSSAGVSRGPPACWSM